MIQSLFLASSFLCANVLGSPTASACKSDEFDDACFDAKNVIQRDVAIIGGGSSGTFAAITLKDMGKSVVVVEKKDKLGGRVLTYTDAASGTHVNYGVRVFENTTITYRFFQRFNTSMVPFTVPTSPPSYVDFTTGQTLSGFAPNRTFTAYTDQIDKYPYLTAGNGFPLPNPIPEDLPLSFGAFVKKYSLQNIAYTIWNDPSLGNVGDILQLPTMNVFKALTRTVLTQAITPGKTLTSPTGNNHETWEKAQAELGDNALLSSTVASAKRPADAAGVRLVVQTASGRKLIKAGKVLFTAAETLDNLKPFGLDKTEKDVFKQLKYTGFYSGLISGSGLPTFGLQNAAAGTERYHIPKQPNPQNIFPTAIPGVSIFWYESATPLSDDAVKKDLVDNIARVTNGTAQNVKFVTFANHSPGILWAPSKDIKAGFWNDMNALQGYRNTYYSGMMFEPSAAGLWNFTQQLIGKMYA